jgi:hypothetical protein
MSMTYARTYRVQIMRSVRVTLALPAKLVVLSDDGKVRPLGQIASLVTRKEDAELFEFMSTSERIVYSRLCRRLALRNVQSLRMQLMTLDVDDAARVAAWLSRAGYAKDPNSNLSEVEWTVGRLTPAIIRFVGRSKELVTWMMAIPGSKFRRAIMKTWEFANEDYQRISIFLEAMSQKKYFPNIKDSGPTFVRSLKLPHGIGLQEVKQCLLRVNNGSILGFLSWTGKGVPELELTTRTPMDAIFLSVHLDKNLAAVCEWGTCASCGKPIQKDRRTERFCRGGKCRNYYNTNLRRQKIRAAQEACKLWDARPGKREGWEKWEWIANRVSTQLRCEVRSEWVRATLSADHSVR